MVTYDESVITYDVESAPPYKLDAFDRELCKVDNIPVMQSVYVHDPHRLPPKEKGTMWIVPRLITELYRDERNDLVYPAGNPKKDGARIRDDKTVDFVRYFRRPITLDRR